MAFANKGDYDAAIKKYQEVLQQKPKSPDAFVGLTRCYLKKKQVAQAYETVTKGLQVADAWPVRVALGEVYFRQGKIPEAEKEWVDVINAGHPAARAYLGLARVRWAMMLNKSAKAMIDRAHELDPADPDIGSPWVATLPRSDRIKYYESSPGVANSCRLVSKVANTTIPLLDLMPAPNYPIGGGLSVVLNGTRTKIMLDTGASGITVKRQTAEKAGITKLIETKIPGVGDRGPRNAYTGIAKSIRIGELEFQDCPVEVVERQVVVDVDGVIGANVFEAFLVDLDFPSKKLRLSELPRPPSQGDDPLALKNNEGDSDDQDRYIAPEMQSFTRVYRFGNNLLVPTKIGDAPDKLFLLDTGAFNNAISPQAAREVTKLGTDPGLRVQGIAGSVKNVYSADQAVLQFGRLRQENQNMVAFDTTSISDIEGTEISGFLGFRMLRFLDIKIDYRDALVDFKYVPNPGRR
jgi:tetratricopeptide (TPR) repeat protein